MHERFDPLSLKPSWEAFPGKEKIERERERHHSIPSPVSSPLWSSSPNALALSSSPSASLFHTHSLSLSLPPLLFIPSPGHIQLVTLGCSSLDKCLLNDCLRAANGETCPPVHCCHTQHICGSKERRGGGVFRSSEKGSSVCIINGLNAVRGENR